MQLAINNISLAIERFGSGPELLLLHGFAGSADDWAAVVPAIARVRSLVVVDLIGHGRSSAPADPARYSMAHGVADLCALLDQFGLEQVDLLGYSMGGRVALQLAVAAPTRVRTLILASASPGLADPGERAARAASDDALAAQIEANGIAWFADYWAGLPLFRSQASMLAKDRAALGARRLRNSIPGLAGSLRGMGTGRQSSLWPMLGALSIPTLLITGAIDPKFVAINAQMAAQLPHAVHVSVQAAGHAVHLERPTAFGEIVVGYL